MTGCCNAELLSLRYRLNETIDWTKVKGQTLYDVRAIMFDSAMDPRFGSKAEQSTGPLSALTSYNSTIALLWYYR